MKLSKTQISKIIQSGRYLGRLLRPLMAVGSPLMKNLPILLTKSAVATTNAGIHKKILGSGTTALIVSNKEMKDMKIVNSL